MIKLVAIRSVGETELELAFSDGSTGCWSAAEIIARNTELTRPLAKPDYFKRAFIEAGALAWPNGLELSAHSLYRKLDEGRTAASASGMKAALGNESMCGSRDGSRLDPAFCGQGLDRGMKAKAKAKAKAANDPASEAESDGGDMFSAAGVAAE